MSSSKVNIMREQPVPPSIRAVVLAGGEGSRVPHLVSSEHPKAMLTVGNRPMLFYSLFALQRAHITRVTVIVESSSESVISDYVLNEYPKAELVAHSLPQLDISIHVRSPDVDTADALRELSISENDTLVLSCDSITDVSLDTLLSAHRSTGATCTVALIESTPVSLPTKASKTSSKTPSFHPDLYALFTSSNRLLTLLYPTDLESSLFTVSKPLTQRYSHLVLRSDLRDSHIYCFHTATLYHVLKHCRQISSVKFDLVPYFARRQHTLQKVAEQSGWTLPTDDFRVYAHTFVPSTYATRANTVESFRMANFDVAAGRLTNWLSGQMDSRSVTSSGASTKKDKKGEKKSRPLTPFKETGERVSVSPDSIIGADCSAGDRTSVKKSVIGDDCVLGNNVKLNNCVLFSNARVLDGSNLTASIVCGEAVIGSKCVLKECCVAASTTVEDGTEASNRNFGAQEEESVMEFADGLGDEVEFY